MILNLLPLTEDERAAFLAAAPDQRFAAGTPLTAEDCAAAEVILGNPAPALLKNVGRLRWLQTRSAGTDNYTAPGVLAGGVLLTSATGAYGPSVSEHIFALLLALMKNLPGYRDQQNCRVWRDLGPAMTLNGATVLVVGTGDLGSSFARLCKAMGARALGVRRDASKGADGIDEMYSFDDLDALLPAADVVALMLPHSPQTAGLFNKERLLRMNPGAILLNGGRGSVIDCMALAEVLSTGHLRGAGLDVTAPEPLPEDHPLWAQPRALITPHAAGGDHLASTARRVAAIALDNLERYLAGQPLRNTVRH